MQSDRHHTAVGSDLIDRAARAVAEHWGRIDARRLAEANRQVLVNLCQVSPSRLLLRLVMAKSAAVRLRAGVLAVAPAADMLDLMSRRMLGAFGVQGLFPLSVQQEGPDSVRNSIAQALFGGNGGDLRARLNALKVESLQQGDLFHDAFLHLKGRLHLEGPAPDLLRFVAGQAMLTGRIAQLFADHQIAALVGFDNTGSGALFSRQALARNIPVLEEDGANPAALWLRRDAIDAADGPQVCPVAFEAAWRQGRTAPATAPSPAADLVAVLGNDPGRPLVGILAQASCGWPHRAPLAFEDHQHWLAKTIGIARRRPDVRWLVIESLEQRLFDDAFNGQPCHQRGDAMIRELVGDAAHIHVWPAKTPIDGLAEHLIALVTGHDPRGLDFAAAGVPVLLAGQPPYAGLGFTVDAISRGGFLDQLARVERLERPAAVQIERARLYRHMALVEGRRVCTLLPDVPAPAPFAAEDGRAVLEGMLERSAGFVPRHDPLWQGAATLLG